ncbi:MULTISPECIES: hypothetical protein [Nostocales]|nr:MULTISPECIES: hypothetical protein [Nostocales]MDK2409369.1 hypothetical protein [Aphanizomenon sp. 202]MDK2458698.1 hypothetical protein [Aphanizomenon sp. PH219]
MSLFQSHVFKHEFFLFPVASSSETLENGNIDAIANFWLKLLGWW